MEVGAGTNSPLNPAVHPFFLSPFKLIPYKMCALLKRLCPWPDSFIAPFVSGKWLNKNFREVCHHVVDDSVTIAKGDMMAAIEAAADANGAAEAEGDVASVMFRVHYTGTPEMVLEPWERTVRISLDVELLWRSLMGGSVGVSPKGGVNVSPKGGVNVSRQGVDGGLQGGHSRVDERVSPRQDAAIPRLGEGPRVGRLVAAVEAAACPQRPPSSHSPPRSDTEAQITGVSLSPHLPPCFVHLRAESTAAESTAVEVILRGVL